MLLNITFSHSDAGVYECRGESGGRKVHLSTALLVSQQQTDNSCLSSSKATLAPYITGGLATIMIPSGKTARLVCPTDHQGAEVTWRDAAGQEVKNDGRWVSHSQTHINA